MGTLEENLRKGDFALNAAITNNLMTVLRKQPSWHDLSADKQHGLFNICRKLARVMCGDPEDRAAWQAIQEYARLVEDRCVTEADKAQLGIPGFFNTYPVTVPICVHGVAAPVLCNACAQALCDSSIAGQDLGAGDSSR